MGKVFVSLCSEDELLDKFYEKRKVRNAPIWMLLDINGGILGIAVESPTFVSESTDTVEEQDDQAQSLKAMLDEVGILPAEKD